MRRTLQTAQCLFQTHPDFNRIKFVVHPDLREKLACACDVPLNDYNLVAHEFMDYFPNFDPWTHMNMDGSQSPTAKKAKHWYLNNMQDDFTKDVRKLIEQGSDFNLEEHVLKTIKNKFPLAIETPYNIYHR